MRTFFNKVAAPASCLLLVGCVVEGGGSLDAFLAEMVGADEAAVYSVWGTPNKSHRAQNGDLVLEFIDVDQRLIPIVTRQERKETCDRRVYETSSSIEPGYRGIDIKSRTTARDDCLNFITSVPRLTMQPVDALCYITIIIDAQSSVMKGYSHRGDC